MGIFRFALQTKDPPRARRRLQVVGAEELELAMALDPRALTPEVGYLYEFKYVPVRVDGPGDGARSRLQLPFGCEVLCWQLCRPAAYQAIHQCIE